MSRKPHDAGGLDLEAFEKARGLFTRGAGVLPDTAVHALAAEVITRLERRGASGPERLPPQSEIEALCDALVSPREDAAADLVLQARLRGMSIDMVYLGYLATAARLLGERWDQDRTTSAQMTIAAGRMYAIMRGLRQAFASDQYMKPDQLRAMFVSTPGETHTLGVTMAADYFRRRGWQIDLRTGMTHRELLSSAEREVYPIIGVSASSERMVFPLARLIVALRISNPAAWIMISGKILDIVPDVLTMVDADGAAEDAEAALSQMMAHVEPAGHQPGRLTN
jgi:MerR family transcriptional regulator, light-induced transcriptional regulator